MRITGAVLRENDGPHQIEQVELAGPASGEILVRVVGAGLCHTDLLPRSPKFMGQPPVILGHEGSGVVEAIGPGVTGFEPGDHVVLSFDSCRACANCRTGHPAYCDTFFPRNLVGHHLDGSTPVVDGDGQPVAARWFGQSSFATHALASARNTVKVDRDLPLELLGPLGCGVQTGAASILIALGVTAGSSVVVFGAGGVGLSAVMAARVAGAAVIIAVDINPARLDLAAELGATHTFHGAEEDLLSRVQEAAGGGVQHALDTTGRPEVITTAINALRPTGTCGLVGVQQGDLSLEPSTLAVGRNVMGILEGDAVPEVFIPRLIALWRQGRFPFDKLIRTFPLSEINAAERASLAGEVVEPVVLP
ncbi:NAD(P)-dependent alcohol dehydrogenase [Kutzneria sp. NPDC052558]|uniref:NAD(P)-dependent alcohol dehydrogenase n=1 Tax=Kutzneria sp. NPDC052558 TaxID=3364121 RepID=UPI0037CB5FD7